ncbi:cyclase family protein [Actinomadura algeriensis]|uniref:Kynurenine formamidase n=1 Tax=Actinomadura algeriensis TaxID=1679523 RepID=A0ABR9JJ90_9ACTN|nr:cyclase family protein [Actinomadura algeriensis]MBE1530220.1 kynurenine formamidase [Actinomadura algeriensis]
MPVIDMDGVRALGRELSNWGRWGDDDQRGTLNLIEPARVTAAATAVRRGVSFSLAMPADENGPHDLRTSGRFNPIHSMTRYRGDTPRGEFMGGFASAEDMLIIGTHSSTHFDALAHLWYDDLLYNGSHHDDAVTARGAERCSIQNLASGVVSRGILADVPRHRGLDHLPPGTGVGPDELDAVLAAQGVVPRPGDVLLLRTGTYPRQRRGFDVEPGRSPGLTFECARWIRDHGIAAVCADNLAVEVLGANGDGPMIPFHMLAIRDMGLLLGEMFDFEDLADDCAADGVYECLFTASPLNVPYAVGSPVNPIAVK